MFARDDNPVVVDDDDAFDFWFCFNCFDDVYPLDVEALFDFEPFARYIGNVKERDQGQFYYSINLIQILKIWFQLTNSYTSIVSSGGSRVFPDRPPRALPFDGIAVLIPLPFVIILSFVGGGDVDKSIIL